MLDEQRHVLAPLAERRQADVHDVQAIVKILAERALAHEISQILVGRRDHARIDGDGLGAADRPDLPLLEHAEELDLEAHRHVADLIEQERAAVRGLEQALVAAVGARERALLVAEELRLEQVLGHGAAVDADEGLLAAVACAVNRAREELLAGARFARDEHARIRRRDHFRLLETGLHRRAPRENLRAPFLVRVGQARDLHRALDVFEQLLLVDGLRQEAERAALRRLDCVGNCPVRRKQQHAQARALPLNLFEQADAVHRLHSQIRDHEIRAEAWQRRERFLRALDSLDFVVLSAQANAQEAQEPRIIVD
jgi:hypothetical protein